MKKPNTTELAVKPRSRGLQSKVAGAVYTGSLLDSDDSILRAKGHDLDVYREILRDDQVTSCYQQRFLSVVGKDWHVEAASESAEDQAAATFVTEQLKNVNFDSITRKMLFGLHYGWAVAETIWAIKDNQVIIDCIKVRDRGNFKFDDDSNLYFNRGGGQFDKMPDNKFWVFSCGADTDDNPYGLGLAHSLYWPTFFKRNGIKFWLVFLEKFGMPTTMAKLPGGQLDDPEETQRALDVLEAIQSDSGVVVPDNLVVELVEAARSGTADYEGLCERMDKAISKVILSQTMTTDDGSSYAQGKVHSAVKDELIKADSDLLCYTFSEQVINPLVAYNFPNAKAPKVWRKIKADDDLALVAERDNKIVNLGYEPTEEYIKETYGDGWRKKADPMPPTGKQLQQMGPEFADVSALTGKRINHRQDQQELIQAAELLAGQYDDLYGDKIRQLISYLEETDDPETFKQQLEVMFSEAPTQAQAKTIAKASFVGRLMGLFKGQGA